MSDLSVSEPVMPRFSCTMPVIVKKVRRPCGELAIGYDGPRRRSVCPKHAPWFPGRIGNDPKAAAPSPCCGSETRPIMVSRAGESVHLYDRCPCGMVWDLGVDAEDEA